MSSVLDDYKIGQNRRVVQKFHHRHMYHFLDKLDEGDDNDDIVEHGEVKLIKKTILDTLT